jgi:peptidoglycan/xylan/chitin deacetylase (PgdA/CDA1 family)
MIADAGFDIGTHSNTHPKMSVLSVSKMSEELEASISKITNITGKSVKYFRAPFGDYSDSVLNVASGLGLKTIQWDVDTLDWKGLSADEIFNRVKTSVKNGSIILCHNNSEHILEALPLIISYLKKEGYQMVKLSELVYENNYIVDNNGLQKSK